MKSIIVAFAITLCSLANAAEKPNILFCIADDASYPHFGANGCSWVKTPNFDRVAKDGLRFTNAYTPNPKCTPSRSCVITGRNPWQLEAAANHRCIYPDKFKSVCESLRDNGYETAYTGKGWSPGVEPKGRMLIGELIDVTGSKPTNGISGDDYAASFARFLKQRNAQKPFFFWYGCFEPHRGYEYKSGVKIGGKRLDMISEKDVPAYWPNRDEVKYDMLDYAFEIEWFDKHLGLMLEVLEKNGLLENTLIIVTSDNGMPFPRSKGHPFELSAHLPLAVMWQGKIVNPGRTCNDLVSFIDFAPTLLEIAGIDQAKSGMETIQGRSLVELFKGAKDVLERQVLLLGRERNDVGRPHDWGYPVRSIRKGDLLFNYNFNPERWPCGNPETGYRDTDDGPTKSAVLKSGNESLFWKACFGYRPQRELYNLAKDPDCMTNLMDNPEWKNAAEELEKELFQRLKEQGDPRMFGKMDYFDQFRYADKKRGLYEREMAKDKNKSKANQEKTSEEDE